MPSLRWLFTLAITVALSLPSPAQNGSINRKTTRATTSPDTGQINNAVYRNQFFNFSYRLPFGWVDRTKDLRDPDDQPKSVLLLSIFEHPPEATGTTINSAVVIAAEKLSSFSGVRTAEEYFSSIKELAEAKDFKATNEPHTYSIGSKQLIRGDFSKPRGTLTMYQSSLSTVEKGYALSLTFIGGSADEVEELVSRVSFGAGKQK